MKRVQFFEITDWQPNVAAFTRVTVLTKDAITVHSTPVDARRVPRELRGTRTLFTSFHHFSPDDARAVLRDAAQSGRVYSGHISFP
jgi:hypothetical protein